jgi:hypothetical protein
MEPDTFKDTKEEVTSREHDQEGRNHHETMEGNPSTASITASSERPIYHTRTVNIGIGIVASHGYTTLASGFLEIEVEDTVNIVLFDAGGDIVGH